MSQAQTTAPTTSPAPAPSQTPSPAATPATPSDPAMPPQTAPPSVTPLPPTTGDALGTFKTPPGKYEEYQSICRTNDFDLTFYLSSELKNKRINLLKEKIKTGKDEVKLRLRLLKELIDQRKPEEANQIYGEIKAQKLSSNENSFADGYLDFMNKKWKSAQTHLEKIAASEPKNTEALKLLAETYKEQKNFFEAAQVYHDLNKLHSGGYYDQLCPTLILDSHHADGEKACQKAILEKPKDPYPLIYLGISSREKEKTKDAINYFNRSIEVKKTEMALTCIGEIYYIENKFTQAIDYFNQSVAHAPHSSRALVGLAWSQLKNKNVDEALASFKKMCALDRKLVIEMRKAYKVLTAQNSPEAKKFIDQMTACTP